MKKPRVLRRLIQESRRLIHELQELTHLIQKPYAQNGYIRVARTQQFQVQRPPAPQRGEQLPQNKGAEY
jgi:hypothetical protein